MGTSKPAHSLLQTLRTAGTGTFTLLLLAALVLSACVSKQPEPAASLNETDPQSLTNTNWVAERILGKSTAVTVSELQLREDGQVGGTTGCNAFSGSVEMAADRMQFGPLATTRRFCAPAVNGQEIAFLEALELTRAWQLSGNVLELLDADSNVIMVLIGG